MPDTKRHLFPAAQAAAQAAGNTTAKELLGALKAAHDALRSYQHGNSSPDLAEEIADFAEATIAKAEQALRKV